MSHLSLKPPKSLGGLATALVLLAVCAPPVHAQSNGDYGYGAPAASARPTQAAAFETAAALRRPIGIALSRDERLLVVANRRSGSLTLIDTAKNQAIAEFPVGLQLSSLASLPASDTLLATDEGRHELLRLRLEHPADAAPKITVLQRLAVSPYPVRVTVARDGRRAFITSLWSRRLTVVELPTTGNEPAAKAAVGEAAPGKEPTGGETNARIAHRVDLPIAPRELTLVRGDQRLIVADSFGGRLLVLDTSKPDSAPVPLGLREFPGHNIRGLGVNHDGTMLVVAHQMLNEVAHTIRNDVHWGLLMSNDLRWLKLDRVLAGGGDLFSGGHMHPLGQAGSATADPAGFAFAPDGTVVVALAGIGEIAMGREADFSLDRLPAGARPTAVAATRDSRWAFVANTFGDSVSRIDLSERETKLDISLGQGKPLTLVDRGELLFHDGKLSHDGWMSCQSCHTDGHTNGQLNDNFSDKTFGAPKRVLTLLGRADTAPFAWNASSPTLADQVRKSLINTMQANKEPSKDMIEAISAYVQTLESPPSIDVLRGVRDDAAVARGQRTFSDLGCVRCHAPPTYTTPKTYDVGLKDQQGNTHFNPPSLRGVGHRAPYFHDNSAASLEDVFRKHGHQLERDLSDAELADLTAFLRSL
jgi:cytochrome c peroxidase